MGTGYRRLRAPAFAGIAVAVAAALPAQAAETKSASKQESIGVLTGLAVGAAAGGPVGAVIGAAAGGWLGDRYHRQAVANKELSSSLDKSETARVQLASSLNESTAERAHLADLAARSSDLATDIGFRTDDASLTEESVARLKKLGALASAVPGAKVRVAGYADPRGAQDYNLALSQRRADAVAVVLKDAGLGVDRVVVEAHGADAANCADGDVDGYAFERRVTVRIEGAENPALARSQ
jgi:outer membrane protein OmpA-like peptidoglycan-associated protein